MEEALEEHRRRKEERRGGGKDGDEKCQASCILYALKLALLAVKYSFSPASAYTTQLPLSNV